MLSISKEMQTRLVLNTGDMANDFTAAKTPKYSDQQYPDWAAYKSIVDSAKGDFENYIDIVGNHDLFGVYGFDSPHSYVFDYSASWTRVPTVCVNFNVCPLKTNEGTFIVVNPYQFPAVHTPLMFWVEADTALLDLIEQAIAKEEDPYVCIHYPIDMWNKAKSSSGKTIEEIVGNPKVKATLTGHAHPKTTQIIHRKGGAVEAVAAGAFEHGVFSIVAEDNGRVSFHDISVSDGAPRAIVTNPVPRSQLSGHAAFSVPQTEVRVLLFGDQNATIDVAGAVSGRLLYRRTIRPGLHLLSIPMSLPPGNYDLHFTGDLTEDISFFVGDSFTTKRETRIAMPGAIARVDSVFPIFWALMAYIAFPVLLWGDSFGKAAADWIDGGGAAHWLTVIFFGPTVIRARLQRRSKAFRILLGVITLLPLLMPTTLIETEGHIGFVWTYGYYMAHLRPARWGMIMTFFYLLISVFTNVTFGSALGLKKPLRWACLLDALCFVAFVVGDIVFIVRYLYETAGPFLSWVSPAFVAVPIVLLCFQIAALIKKFRGNSQQRTATL